MNDGVKSQSEEVLSKPEMDHWQGVGRSCIHDRAILRHSIRFIIQLLTTTAIHQSSLPNSVKVASLIETGWMLFL